MMAAVACILISYDCASWWESFAHRTILHAPHEQARGWCRLGLMGTGMRRARFNHLVHHKLASSPYWTPQRLLRSAQLSRAIP